MILNINKYSVKWELTHTTSFATVDFVNKSTAIAVSIASALIFITPVLAQNPINPTQKMQNLEDKRLKIASHEAQIRTKIQAFKDKQKAQIATRINTNLNKINQNQTDQMLKNLDLMSSLLDKLTARVNQGTPDIKDPATANQAIADARAAIDAARTAVEAQAQKDYTINVTTETKIKLDAKAQRDQLYKNIMATRKLVIDAKQAVSNAIRVAKSGSKEATPSGQQ